MLIQLLAEIAEDKGKLPFHDSYGKTVEMAEDIQVHAALDKLPDKLFQERAPNEDHAARKYRKASYQPETRPIWNKALSETNRIFNKQNYSLTFKDEKQGGYFLEEAQITEFFKDIVLGRKLNDANAVLTVFPNDVRDDREEYNPKILMFNADQVIEYNTTGQDIRSLTTINSEEDVDIYEDEFVNANFFFLKSVLKSVVLVGKKEREEGLVFYYIDAHNIYLVKQYGKQNEWLFEILPMFDDVIGHNLGYVPVQFLEGIEVTQETITYFKSWFQDAVPPLNQVLYDSSNLQLVKTAHAFPIKVEYYDPCDESGCDGGQIETCNEVDNVLSCVQQTCGKCHGTGHKSKSGPLGVYQLRTPSKLEDGDIQVPFPGIGFVAPDTAILDFLRSEINVNKRASFDFMGIDVSSSDVTATKEMATTKVIDRESLFSFLLGVSSQIFQLLDWTILTVGKIRYGVTFTEESYTLKAPSAFDIRTYADLTNEYASAKDAGLPQSYLDSLRKELQIVRFGNEGDPKEQLKTFVLGDYIKKDDLEILALYGAGILTDWEIELINNFDRYTTGLDLEGDMAKNMAFAIDSAKAYVNAKKTPIIDIEGIITGVPTDNKLRTTVGGVQGILEIQASLSAGLTDRDSAIQMLIQLYGFSEDDANKLLGDPKIIKINEPVK